MFCQKCGQELNENDVCENCFPFLIDNPTSKTNNNKSMRKKLTFNDIFDDTDSNDDEPKKKTIFSTKFGNKSTSTDNRFGNKSTSNDNRFRNKSTSNDNRFGNKSTSDDNRFGNKSSSDDNRFRNRFTSNDNDFGNKASSDDNRFRNRFTSNDNNFGNKVSSDDNKFRNKSISNDDSLKNKSTSIFNRSELKASIDADKFENKSSSIENKFGNKSISNGDSFENRTTSNANSFGNKSISNDDRLRNRSNTNNSTEKKLAFKDIFEDSDYTDDIQKKQKNKTKSSNETLRNRDKFNDAIRDENKISKSEIISFVGEKNSDYFIKNWNKSQENKNFLSLNLPALFVNFFWFWYRKMYGMTVIIFSLTIILSILMGVFVLVILAPIASDFSPYISEHKWISLVACALVPLGISLNANQLYIKHVIKKITRIKSKNSPDFDNDKFIKELNLAGGTTLIPLIFIIVILTISIVYITVVIDPSIIIRCINYVLNFIKKLF